MKQQDEAPRDLKYFTTLLPAPACVICGGALDQIGGRRITGHWYRGMAVTKMCWAIHGRPNPTQYLRLIEGEEIFLVVWGEKEIFTGEVVERIRTTYLSARRPWMCQKTGCGDMACVCGMPLRMTPCCNVLHDGGEHRRQMVVSGEVGCTNVDCKKYPHFSED